MENNSYNFKDEIKRQIQDSSDLKEEIISIHTDTIDDIVNKIVKAYNSKNKVLWFGNGGSAADAQHLSCELVSKFLMDRKAIPQYL